MTITQGQRPARRVSGSMIGARRCDRRRERDEEPDATSVRRAIATFAVARGDPARCPRRLRRRRRDRDRRSTRRSTLPTGTLSKAELASRRPTGSAPTRPSGSSPTPSRPSFGKDGPQPEEVEASADVLGVTAERGAGADRPALAAAAAEVGAAAVGRVPRPDARPAPSITPNRSARPRRGRRPRRLLPGRARLPEGPSSSSRRRRRTLGLEGLRRSRHRLLTGRRAVTAPGAGPDRRIAVGLVLSGIASVQFGSALATHIFDEVGAGRDGAAADASSPRDRARGLLAPGRPVDGPGRPMRDIAPVRDHASPA